MIRSFINDIEYIFQSCKSKRNDNSVNDSIKCVVELLVLPCFQAQHKELEALLAQRNDKEAHYEIINRAAL